MVDIEELIEILKTYPPKAKVGGQLWYHINEDTKLFSVGDPSKHIPTTIAIHDARQVSAMS